MKRNLLSLVVMGGLLLALFNFSWSQCPEDTIDLGECDTLHVVPWPETDTCFIGCNFFGCDTICINEPGKNFPAFMYVNLLVTHDSNTFYWEEEDEWIQDSIATMVVPLAWTRTNPTAYCSLSEYWNTNQLTKYELNFRRSLWRHFHPSELDSNRMTLIKDIAAWNTNVNMCSDSCEVAGTMTPPHVFIAAIPIGAPYWWEGDRTLLATLTFRLEDTMTICMDTTFWPPESNYLFVRQDAVEYVPRDDLPLCIWGGPPILVTSPNGGETWGVGETHDITWLSKNFTGEDVKLQFSTDGGANWMTIEESTPNDGAYPWLIPDTTSESCRVRVSDAEDGDPNDVSDSDFSISTPPPDFTIEAEPETLRVVAGESVGCDVILDSLYGFSSLCTLTVEEDSLPGSTTYDFNPATVVPPDTSILTFHTDVSTPAGTSTIIVTGSEMSGGKNGIEHNTQVVLIVTSQPDFAIDVIPDTLRVPRGYSGDYDVILTSINGFDSPCTLEVSGHPGGSTATFQDSVLIPTDTTILTIAIPDMATLDTLALIITATEVGDGKQITHSDTVTLIVTLPSWMFKVKAFPDTQIVVQGNSTTYGVTIIPNQGFTAPCSLFVIEDSLPDYATAEFDSNPIPPNDTSTLTITTQLTTPPDTCDLAIVAVANPKQKDTTYVKLIVTEQTDVEGEGDQLNVPDKFALFQNQPNPFNPETKISYYLPEGCEVKLTIYNILGRRVKTLWEGYQTQGMKTSDWDGRDDQRKQLSSGIYFYRLQAGKFTETRKMTLLK
ncbi:MAG: T9SS type A sorting domain-containing protein [candidate division Zixibacteria bacterium]|nr:T9SS type A sorting domain-containing protein [candidate division Zixibacteria bacterium]